MKRSLTIGCVLLVGSGVTNCGGSAELGTPEGASGAHAGASGSGVAGGSTGAVELGAGGAGPYVGVAVEPGGGRGFVGQIGDVLGYSGAGGWEEQSVGAGAGGWEEESAGAGGDSNQGGAAGSSHVPPAVGVAPHGGTGGGWMGVPPA